MGSRRTRPSVVLLGIISLSVIALGSMAGGRDLVGDHRQVGTVARASVVAARPHVRHRPSAVDTSAIEEYRQPGWITRENRRPGTRTWLVSAKSSTWDLIRGYADHTSVNWGGSFGLYVTTAAATWHAEIYRMGWYGGAQARLIWTSQELPGQVQSAVVTDPDTLMRSTHWQRSLEVHTGKGWPPGVYLIKLVSSDGGASWVPMVVRDDGSHAALAVQSSVTTWEAYNTWGGASLYSGPYANPALRSKVVSFDRPYDDTGSGEFFGREFEFVNWVERNGYDVTYWTDIDLDEHPELARNHKAVISLGHDEYYSTTMRSGLQTARDHGVNLAFFGANAIFRKIRLEPSPLGPDRLEVNYRVASEDPLDGTDDAQVTVNWRDPPSDDPESSLIGDYYQCNPVSASLVVADASAWMFRGSDFVDGDIVPTAVGNEYDHVDPAAPTPSDIQVLTHSPVTCHGQRSYSDSSYYSAPSGAGVWASGTFWWEQFLEWPCPPITPTSTPTCKLQQVTKNIVDAFSRGPAGRAHPSTNNLASLGITRGTSPSVTEPND